MKRPETHHQRACPYLHDGVDSIGATVKELGEHGYIIRRGIRKISNRKTSEILSFWILG